MSESGQYTPSSSTHATIDKSGENWTLVLTRDLRHSPEIVWKALVDPTQIHEWAPFDASGNLGATGNIVKLATIGAPSEHITETTITRADAPKVLEFNWGGGNLRWELESINGGTRLTLHANIDHRYIPMGAAGWHVCLDVMERYLDGSPLGRIAGMDAMQSAGWQQLHAQYSKQFSVEPPKWSA